MSYRLFARSVGTTFKPDASSYDILTQQQRAYAIYDPKVEGLSKYIQSPKADLSYNSAGSCSFTVLYGHPFYSEIHPYKTEILLYDGDDCIWMGRVASIESYDDQSKSYDVTAEGLLAELNDINIWPVDASNTTPEEWSVTDCYVYNIRPALTCCSRKRGNISKFYLPYPTDNNFYTEIAKFIKDPTDSKRRVTITNPQKSIALDYMSVKAYIDKITGLIGGFFYIRPYIDTNASGEPLYAALCYYPDMPTTPGPYPNPMKSTFSAYLNVNIEKIKKTQSIDGFATAIFPKGALINEEAGLYKPMERYGLSGYTSSIPSGFGVEISTTEECETGYGTATPTSLPGYVYNTNAVTLYGWIEKYIVYDDLTDPDDILTNALIDLTNCLIQQAGIEITANTLYTPSSDGPISNRTNSTPHIMDAVYIYAKEFGMEGTMYPILDMSVNLDDPSSAKFNLTKTGRTYISNLYAWR